MQSLAGTSWKLVDVRAFDAEGRKLPAPIGPRPMGISTFDAERMVGIVTDGRTSPPPEGESRFFFAYAGPYRFDGAELVTEPDAASGQDLLVPQVRRVRFETPTRVVMIPVSGVPGKSGIEVVWERID